MIYIFFSRRKFAARRTGAGQRSSACAATSRAPAPPLRIWTLWSTPVSRDWTSVRKYRTVILGFFFGGGGGERWTRLSQNVVPLPGAACYPSCVVALDMDLHDPVALANGMTSDTLRHWMLPVKVQVGTHVESFSRPVPWFIFLFSLRNRVYRFS